MSGSGFIGNKYNIFSVSEVERIHATALDILEKIGMKIESEKILRLLESSSAQVDYQNQIVRFPKSLVMELLSLAPKKISLYGRKDEHILNVGGRKVYFGTGGAANMILDLNTGERRKPVLDDLAKLARLVDKMEYVHWFLRPVVASDLEGEQLDVNKAYVGLSNTYKNTMFGIWTASGAKKIIEMASIIAGGEQNLRQKPIISFISAPIISPLKFNVETFPIIETISKARIPHAIASNPVTGSTGPATIAGAVTLSHAEAIFCVILAQIINEGTPVLYCALISNSEMRSMNYLEGGIEAGMGGAGLAQLADYLDLPMVSDAGTTDSKLPDIQAGYEKMANILQVALAGGNCIHHSAGMLESMMTVAYEQIVIDNDINGMVQRALQGIAVNDDTIAYKIIKNVGPGGTFIAEEHTVKYFRNNEFFTPKVADRNTREVWESEGSLDARERAKQIAKDILKTHHPKPIPEEIDRKIREKFDIVAN